jgi:hypothetical protein
MMLKKRIELEDYFLHFSNKDNALLWLGLLLIKRNFNFWILWILINLDLNLWIKLWGSEKEFLEKLNLKCSKGNNLMAQCIFAY